MKELFTGFRQATRVRKPGKVVTSPRDQQLQGLATASRRKGKVGVVTRAQGQLQLGEGLEWESGPTLSPAAGELAE